MVCANKFSFSEIIFIIFFNFLEPSAHIGKRNVKFSRQYGQADNLLCRLCSFEFIVYYVLCLIKYLSFDLTLFLFYVYRYGE